MPLTSGSRFGAYEIGASLGEGGMGQVYRAHDTKLNRDVALKVVLPSVANDPERLARFKREAHLLASLNHPNIAAIYGFEDGTGVHALVMELVDGPTLADRLAAGPIPLSEALAIAKQIAEALELAHEQGIVHRDLKPANIKVRGDGTVKVLDFGLAKAIDPTSSSMANASLSPTLSLQATEAGLILGTAAYMSPEQAKGRAVDKRADIWAFGVVLYEMITGRRGYLAEDVSETLAAVLTRDVDWTALPPDTPPRLQQLLRDCLVRDPKQRLRDIGEARRVLERLMSGAPDPASTIAIAAAPPAPVWKRALPWTIAAAAVAIAIGLALTRRSAAPPITGGVTRSRTALKDLAGFVALSRDGTTLVYTVSSNDGFVLALRRLDEFEPRILTGSSDGVFPLISPDGQWIAFSTNTDSAVVKKIPIAGGTPITLCNGLFNWGAAWGPDDTIVFTDPKGLRQVPANGGTPKFLTQVDKSKGERSHWRPQFLPGGKQLLFTIVGADGQQFAVLDLEKGGYRTIAKGGDNGRYAPTGHLLYVTDGTLFAQPFDLTRLTTTGPESPVVERISTTGPTGTADYTFSDTGVLVYSERGTAAGTTLALADRKGTIQALPGQVSRNWGTGRLSPDGRRVANAIEDAKKDRDIWVVDLDRGAPTRLTFAGYNDFPIWTPDGKRVVYGERSPKPGLYAVAADGGGNPELVLATETQPVPASISPDGKTLLYSVGIRTQVLAIDGMRAAGEPHPLRDSPAGERMAQISPDGKWVAFLSNESGTLEVYLMPFPGPGPKVRVSTGTGNIPRWNRNGRELLFWTATAGSASLMSASIQTSSGTLSVAVPTELFKMLIGSTWDVAPDGEHFLVEITQITGVGSTFATVTNWFDELRRRAPPRK
ncbi:MAG TPA: protein kinase [Vicinamibacterales bacterium]